MHFRIIPSTSFATAFLPPLTSAFLPPLAPPLAPSLASSLLSRYNRSNNCDRSDKICEESSYTDISEFSVEGIVDSIVAFFLTGFLSLLGDSKKSGLTRIFLNFYFSFITANVFIRS